MNTVKITDVRSHQADSGFLIDDGTTSVLYDSGYGFTGFEVAENIKRYLGERSLDYIFLSHSHYDHAAGAAYVLKMYPNAKIVAGEHAANVFKKDSAKKVMRELDRKYADACGYGQYEDLFDNLTAHITVKDGDVINAGNMTFTAIWLPGHTKCSFGFYLQQEKLLLSTETLGVYIDNKTVIPAYLVGYKMTLDSIKKAERLDIEKILIPHFGVLNKAQFKNYISNSKEITIETANEIANILKSGGTHNDALEYFKNKFYHGPAKVIYPIAALELNTSIMIKLIEKEVVQEQ